jgi:hypothetical protein
VKRSYHTINKQGKANENKLAEFLSKGGQLLLPMVDLIEQCQMACDELIDVAGRAAIQAVLGLSAQQVAGPRQQGKQRTGEVVWYGQQSGTVMSATASWRCIGRDCARKGRERAGPNSIRSASSVIFLPAPVSSASPAFRTTCNVNRALSAASPRCVIRNRSPNSFSLGGLTHKSAKNARPAQAHREMETLIL